MALARTAFVVQRRFESLMQEHGVTSQQYNVLRILRGAGGSLPTMMITERMIEPEPAITRIVRRLEDKGLIRRTPGTSDARQVLCELSDAGRRTLEALDVPVREMTRHLVRRVGPDQLTSLISILADIRAAADEAAPA